MSSQLVVFSVLLLLPPIWSSAIPAEYKDSSSLGINGGHKVPIEAVPFMAMVVIPLLDGNFSFCGGSIVHERFILTAAHCVHNATGPSSSWGYVGSSSLYDEKPVFIQPEEMYCHEGFSNRSGANDICLIKLKYPLQYNEKVSPVTLPDADLEIESGTLCNVTGWGRTKNQNQTSVIDLHQVLVPIRSDNDCRKYYPSTTDSQICAGSRNHDSCSGDSGSPLTLNNIQVGVVSYGRRRRCGRKYGAVYTRVTSYLDWISSIISDNE